MKDNTPPGDAGVGAGWVADGPSQAVFEPSKTAAAVQGRPPAGCIKCSHDGQTPCGHWIMSIHDTSMTRYDP